MYNKFGLKFRKNHGVVPLTLFGRMKAGLWLVVETDRGQECAETVPIIEKSTRLDKNIVVKKVLWLADEADLEKLKRLEADEKEIFIRAAQMVRGKNLPVRIVLAEMIFDRKKVLFHYKWTDEKKAKKVNIKEIAREIGQRLGVFAEMHQIGVRGEAKILSELGCCGERLCCLSWLNKSEPITIKMAKEQNLPLNITKISGLCGRLMCCLKYELKNYQENYDKIKGLNPLLEKENKNPGKKGTGHRG